MVCPGSGVGLIMQAHQDSCAGEKDFKIRKILDLSLPCIRGSFLKNTLWNSYWETAWF